MVRLACAPLALLAVLTVGTARAAFVEHVVEFAAGDLVVERGAPYDTVRLAGCDITREVGKPELPALALTIALPRGAVATALEATSSPVVLAGSFLPSPSQPPRILPVPGLALPEWRPAGADAEVYGSASPYPASVATLSAAGRLAGTSTAGIVLHPVQFLPDRRQLVFHRSVTLRVEYDTREAELETRVAAPARDVAASVVANASRLAALEASPAGGAAPAGGRLPSGEFEYVVVTAAAIEDAFAPLVAWKTKKGVPAKTVTVEWIGSNYAGPDTQAKIRSFIADARAEWGTTWVLLGGDTGLVPARRAYAMTCEAGGHPDEDAIACDLYFSDLDGDWNADGDATYGETSDGVDLYPDVFVGRASVQSTAQAEAFVGKVLGYERSPDPGWLLDMLLAAEILWSDPYTDSSIALDLIDHEHVPPRYDPITKLYESLGNESVASVVAAVNAGKSHFLHSGHAWYDCMGCGTGYLSTAGVDGLTNEREQPLLYSIGCWPAAFDLSQDCMAERFIRNPHGGAAAFIGNSRYGWAAPGNPGYGYSERFMQAFYDVLFHDGLRHAGAALAAAKARFVPFARDPNVYRWHEYEVNLLGDPEMNVWTDEPADLVVSLPAGVAAGPSRFNVGVSSGGAPVRGALVCVTDGAGVYERGLTGGDGLIGFDVTAAAGALDVTVTAPDCRPYEASVPVAASGPWIVVASRSVDDSSGNADGLPGPGEAFGLTVVLRNDGTEAAAGVEATLALSDPWVSVSGGVASYGDIAAGASSQGAPFALEIAPGAPGGHTALASISVTDGRTSWTEAVPIMVAAPALRAGLPSADDSAGDGDGVAEPGETLLLLVPLTNEGLAAADAPTAFLTSLDALVEVSGATAGLGAIGPGATAHAVFEVRIDASCPSPRFPALVVATETVDGFASEDTLVIVVGASGTGSDFESGSAGWASSGAGDMWHLSTYRSHSGSTSWYCGSDATHAYADNMDCSLTSPAFVLAPEMEVSFWCWHSVPIYGEDGLFVEIVSHGSVTDTLDFIGSGGALGALPIGNDWLERRYALDESGTVGDTVQVRFRFSSNASETAEGFHVDDVLVASGAVPPATDVPEDGPGASVLFLGQNAPNPFAASTRVVFSLARPAGVTVAVYAPSGRLIRGLFDGRLGAGEHSVAWDGLDGTGAPVAAGVYMIRVTAGGENRARKVVALR